MSCRSFRKFCGDAMTPRLPDYSRSMAVLIGTSAYQDAAFPAVPAAANSVTGLREVLTDPRLCGWPPERILVIRDATDSRRLVQRLRRLAKETHDVLVLYFAGHGVLTPGGELCLILTDTDASDPDVTGVEYARVREALVESPARMKVAILDCCFSGRAIESLSGVSGVADSTDTRGVYTLTASDHAAHVPPIERQTTAYTSFTGELLDLIRTGIPGEPDTLTLNVIYHQLRHRLRTRGLPAPNQRGTDTADRFTFTLNAAIPSALPTPHEQTLPTMPLATSEGPGRDGDARGEPLDQNARGSRRRRPRRRTVLLSAATALVLLAVSILIAVVTSQPPGGTHPVAVFPRQAAAVMSVAFSPDRKSLASGSKDGKVQLWDIATRHPSFTLNSSADPIFAVAFSPDGKTLAVGGGHSTVELWDVATRQSVALRGPGDNIIRSVAFSRDGRTVAGGGEGKIIQLWDVHTRKSRTLPGTTARVNALAFSPDRETLASGGDDDGSVRVWDTATAKPVAGFANSDGDVVRSLTFSPDGKTLAAGCNAAIVRLWNVATKARTIDLKGQSASIFSVAFSPDGSILAGASGDGTVWLWDVATRNHIATFPGSNTIESVAFSPDGKTVASGGDDRTVRLWHVPA